MRRFWFRRVAALCAAFLSVVACSRSTPIGPTPPTTTPPATSAPPSISGLTIQCPASLALTSQNGGPVAVTFSAPTTLGGVAPVQVSCSATSGSMFPVGTTNVQCTATDARPVTQSCSFVVSVAPPPPQISRTRFLAFGDSTTLGEVTAPVGSLRGESTYSRLVIVPAAAYPTQLLTQLRARYTAQTSALEMFNAGLSGEWAEDGAVRLPGVLANQRPQAVLLLEGTNDLAALGTPGIQTAWRAIDTMAKEIRGRGARAFLATLPPPRPGPRAIPLSLIQTLNANIRTTARGEGAVLVDIYEALNVDPTRYIGVDGLHPNEAGYQRIAETFFLAIRQDLEIR